MKTKIAKGLLRQRDPIQRRRMILICSIVLLLLLLAHGFFSDMASPLKLIPQTLTAIGMGYLILQIVALRQFTHLVEFIDWTKVKEAAEPAHPDDARPH
jgi:hypothetical protein